MFERFTEKAKVVMLAKEESRRLGHNLIGTEQLLLGMIGEGTGLAAQVLTTFKIDLDVVRFEVEKIIGRGTCESNIQIPFTPRAKRSLELALEGSRELGHGYVGIEHLLLALVREGEGVAIRVLTNLGVNLQELELRLLEQSQQFRSERGARQLAERLRALLRAWVQPRSLGQVGSNTRLSLGRDFLAVDLY